MDINYMQVEPNSHSYGSLENFIATSQLVLFPEYLEREYILTGLLNTQKAGLELKLNNKKIKKPPLLYFESIKDIINFVSYENFNVKVFISLIESTIKNGYNLASKNVMERKEVYNNLDIERDYQDLNSLNRKLIDNDVDDSEKPITEWINYMEFHLNKAKSNVYHFNSVEVLAEIRKVTALGVCTMEIHGCPKRIID